MRSRRQRNSAPPQRGKGYGGQVTLRSPSGELVTVEVPGRTFRWYSGKIEPRDDVLSKRQDRKFRRLLSAGYTVVSDRRSPEGDEPKAGEEEKKLTSIVIGTTQTGSTSHGGKHASRQVEDSPNAANAGKRPRGCRGGQKKRSQDKRRRIAKVQSRIQVQRSNQSGSTSVYSPQPLEVSPELLASAESSAKLLGELVGRSAIKVKRGITVDIYRLLVALEVGDNPLPALEAPNHKRKLRILATPDCSGSTQGWNGLGQAWALHLAKLPDVEVVYAANFNGQFFELSSDKATTELIESVDLVLYLGDHDGRQMCEHYASLGATVVALDSYSASVAKPRLATSMALGQGTLYWVDRVSAKEPATWAKAVELCLSR